MTEDPKGQVDKETRSLRRATFECVYCHGGTENFTTLFEDGTCTQCSAPAGVVVEISRPEDIEKIQQSVVLIASDVDSDKAMQITRELTDKGINVIDPKIVVENEQAGNRANVLAFIVDNSKSVLVIPSEKGQFSEDRLVSAAVEQAMISNKKNIVPLYPDDSYKGRSGFLDTRQGVQWDGLGGRSWDKSRFMDYVTMNIQD